MRRTLPLSIVLVALLAPATASAIQSGAGHNQPTRQLEYAFKIGLYARSVSQDGCYPPPEEFAAAIRKVKPRLKVRIVLGVGAVRRRGILYLLSRGWSCDRIRMAWRAKNGLYILDSATGNVQVRGKHRGPKTNPGQSGPPRELRIVTNSVRLQSPDQVERLSAQCPRRSFPLGGGMVSSSGPTLDGEGVYPHSSERLGAQRGWHMNITLYEPSPGSITPRTVTIQAVCARGLRPATPTPHNAIFIKSDQTKTATAQCPNGQFLIGGGFNRTNFESDGGNYVTESRADGPSAWRVTGSAFGGSGGGELIAIAYCVKHRGPILTEVSGSAPIAFRALSKATTAPCPPGLTMTATGFSSSPGSFYAGSSLDPEGTSTATAFGYFAAVPSLTAYGYCLQAKG
jgi:hypothetical protein